MFSVCKQTHPATGIEHSISCRFFNNYEENIVTAGANILKVFRITPDVDPNTTEKFSGECDVTGCGISQIVSVPNNFHFRRFEATKNALGMHCNL